MNARQPIPMHPPADLAKRESIDSIVRPLAEARYTCDIPWDSLETYLAGLERDYGLDLAPDYQRGHVWSHEQQAHFIENVFRGVITRTGMAIKLNCPNWEDDSFAGDLCRGITILDGLQRLTAVRKFMAGEVRPFGLDIEDFAGTVYNPLKFKSRWMLRIEMLTFATRRELLQHYLDLNAGGTPHALSELDRVRDLLVSAQ